MSPFWPRRSRTLNEELPQKADSVLPDGADLDYSPPVTHQQNESDMTSAVMDPQSVKKPGSPVSASFPELSDKLEKDLVQVFKLMADETRLKILMYLIREGELHVSALCERLNQSQPAVSHHLALLRVAGLIEPRRDGKHNFYSVQKNRFHEIVAQLFENFSAEGQTVRFEDFTLSQKN